MRGQGGQGGDVVYTDHRTALHLACSEGHLECVQYLVTVCKVDTGIADR